MTAAKTPLPDRRLVVSIHDVSPAFEDPIDRLADMIGDILGGPRFAMLVVPDHWGAAPLDRALAFARRLRGWADAGVEMFLHGWFHRDTSDHRGAGAAIKARYMTAGEGEFLGLSADEAERRGEGQAEAVEPGSEVGAGRRHLNGDTPSRLQRDHAAVSPAGRRPQRPTRGRLRRPQPAAGSTGSARCRCP